MKTLLVQQYLRSGKTLEQLKTEHGIKYNETNGKICFNYDQIEAKESDALACQCRGLVLEKDTWNTIAVPFFRFFNYGQEQAATIDWESAAFEDKLDGSLIIAYNYNNKWYCGTRGRCEADAPAHESERTFANLVDITIRLNPPTDNTDINLQDFMQGADKECTYIFELTTPINRVVCRYDEFSLTLLGVRNKNTLQEEEPQKHIPRFGNFNIGIPKLYKFNSIDNMVEVIREWNPEFHEGIVIKDMHFNRIKVKNPSYVAYNHLRDSLTTSFRGCIEVILLKKDDDIIHMMPGIIANRINKLKPAVSEVFRQLNNDYERLKDIQDIKAFALEAQKCVWPGPLFAMKRGKIKDLDGFIFNKTSGSHIQTSMVDTILELCRKVDPSLKGLL